VSLVTFNSSAHIVQNTLHAAKIKYNWTSRGTKCMAGIQGLLLIIIVICLIKGKRWRSCLSNYATSRKVVVSIPDGVIGIFH
jgi:hypothetical protein